MNLTYTPKDPYHKPMGKVYNFLLVQNEFAVDSLKSDG